jgi:murein DD-endopeptidase MepM/ murein hydrolase activator NlpD
MAKLRLQRPVKWERIKDRRLTQGFGNDFFVNGKWVYRSMWYPGHMWLDYAGKTSWMKIPVYATEDGRCYIAKSSNWYGNHIKFYFTQDNQNYRCVYWHLDSFSVVHKQFVKKWEQVWIMWTTWYSNWVHLHFDVIKCDKNWRVIDTKDWYKWFFDPAPYIVDRDIPKEKSVDEKALELMKKLWIRNGKDWNKNITRKQVVLMIARLYALLHK